MTGRQKADDRAGASQRRTAPPEEWTKRLGHREHALAAEKAFQLPDDKRFNADIIDTWGMTVTPVKGLHGGSFRLELPGKPYVAVRFTVTPG